MAWVAVNENDIDILTPFKPTRTGNMWNCQDEFHFEQTCFYEDYYTEEVNYVDLSIPLPKGSIKKLIGKELTWNDEPVELKEE